MEYHTDGQTTNFTSAPQYFDLTVTADGKEREKKEEEGKTGSVSCNPSVPVSKDYRVMTWEEVKKDVLTGNIAGKYYICADGTAKEIPEKFDLDDIFTHHAAKLEFAEKLPRKSFVLPGGVRATAPETLGQTKEENQKQFPAVGDAIWKAITECLKTMDVRLEDESKVDWVMVGNTMLQITECVKECIRNY